MSAATDLSVGLWPSMAESPALTVAVGAPVPAHARRLADILERDGVLVTATFTGLPEIPLDRLAPHLDVVVLVAGLDDGETERGVRETRSALRYAAIVVVCARSAGRQLPHYLEAGADGLVFADDLNVTLAATVRSAAAGQMSVPQSMRHLLAPPALSYREKQVLELAARGLTNRQIAGSLFLAESTVKTHLSAAFRRLGVNSRREAAALICATDNHTRQLLLPASPRALGSRTASGRIENWQRPVREEA
jgi:DNA-binding NarL/FixJ family response regulator